MKIINKTSSNAQQGFTLIELVVVIVILGILAATAAPKFIDLTGDARASTLQGVRGSIESATTMVHAKSLIAGETDTTGGLDLDGDDTDDVALRFSWPTSDTTTWDELLDINAEDFLSVADTVRIVWYHTQDTAFNNTAAARNGGCYVSYTESADSNTRPAILVVTDDC
jgi:MSHA pilin protein MshA